MDASHNDRVLRCAEALFAPKPILNRAQALQQAHNMALRPPLTPLNDAGGAPNHLYACVQRQGPPS
jgi:hypothetical protein